MDTSLTARIEHAARTSWDEANGTPTMVWQHVGDYSQYDSIMTIKTRVQKRTGWKIQLESDAAEGVYIRRTD
jgi:hypothetical protein